MWTDAQTELHEGGAACMPGTQGLHRMHLAGAAADKGTKTSCACSLKLVQGFCRRLGAWGHLGERHVMRVRATQLFECSLPCFFIHGSSQRIAGCDAAYRTFSRCAIPGSSLREQAGKSVCKSCVPITACHMLRVGKGGGEGLVQRV